MRVDLLLQLNIIQFNSTIQTIQIFRCNLQFDLYPNSEMLECVDILFLFQGREGDTLTTELQYQDFVRVNAKTRHFSAALHSPGQH